MGFLTELRVHAVRVVITDPPDSHKDEFDLSRFQAGQTYEVGPRAAEYLIGSKYAVLDRRQIPRDISFAHDRSRR